MSVDALGNPLCLLLTAGQAHEAPHAKALLEGYETEFVLGDKAYDAKAILLTVTDMGAEAVIPPRSNRKEQREYDEEQGASRSRVLYWQTKALPPLLLSLR